MHMPVKTVSHQTLFSKFNFQLNQFPVLMLTNGDSTRAGCSLQVILELLEFVVFMMWVCDNSFWLG